MVKSRLKKTTPSAGYSLSNPALLVILAVVGAGILLDGTLYNRPQQIPTIYPIEAATEIELHVDNQLITRFEKVRDSWHQTQPVLAPAHGERVQVLLDTNHFSRRHYKNNEIPSETVFNNPITLTINNASYEFGTLEPVSKLRYVRANDRVYLQPDSVIPLLSATNNAFIDLRVTGKVEQLKIGDTVLQKPANWSNLMATDVLTEAPAGEGLNIQLTESSRTLTLVAKVTDAGYSLSHENGFHYLLDADTAVVTGLADLQLLNSN